MTHVPTVGAIFLPHEIAALFNSDPADVFIDADVGHFTVPAAAFSPAGSPLTPSREVAAEAD